MRLAGRLVFAVRKPSRQFLRKFSSITNIPARSNHEGDPAAEQQDEHLSQPSFSYHKVGKVSDPKSESREIGRYILKSVSIATKVDLDLKPANDAPSSGCRNRGILLTGGTGGIGFAVAKRLVREGAGRIVLISRDAKRGNEAVTKIREQTQLPDAPVSVLELDVAATSVLTTDIAESTNKLNTLLENFPYCNTLINCAGIPQYQLILKSTPEEQRAILDTNLKAPMMLSKLFLSHYLSSRTRRKDTDSQTRPPGFNENIMQSYVAVNVSSLLAHKSVVGTADYATAKAGLIAHTRVLALEGGRYFEMRGGRSPFRANVVVPGYIDTPMTESFSGRTRQDLENQIPLHRFGTPEEVADAIVFLIANEYANNCVLNLDGGLSAT